MHIYKEQSANIWKTWILMIGFLVVVIGVGFAFARIYDNPIILYIAIAISLLLNVWSYWFSDKLVLSLYKAKPVNRAEHTDLWNVVENLSITAGLPMPKVYIIPDNAPNAFATGRDPEHSAVAVTQGLLNILDRSELEGVVAHELAHIKNRDILLSTVVIVLVGAISIVADMLLRGSMLGGMGDRENKNGAVAIIGLVLVILSPIALTIIQLAISRKREYLADASASLLTRYPEGLASALEKIGGYSGEMKRATKATAHMFIANPFSDTGAHIKSLFSTHPPILDRIRILRGK